MKHQNELEAARAPGADEDDPFSARLLAAYGTNEARRRTCRALGRGLAERQAKEILAHRVTAITCHFPSGEPSLDHACTAVVEIEYGAYCCKSWGWLLVKASGHPSARRPFQCVEVDGDDSRPLEHVLRRVAAIDAELAGPHG